MIRRVCDWLNPFLTYVPVAVLDVVGDFLRDSNQLEHVCDQTVRNGSEFFKVPLKRIFLFHI